MRPVLNPVPFDARVLAKGERHPPTLNERELQVLRSLVPGETKVAARTSVNRSLRKLGLVVGMPIRLTKLGRDVLEQYSRGT